MLTDRDRAISLKLSSLRKIEEIMLDAGAIEDHTRAQATNTKHLHIEWPAGTYMIRKRIRAILQSEYAQYYIYLRLQEMEAKSTKQTDQRVHAFLDIRVPDDIEKHNSAIWERAVTASETLEVSSYRNTPKKGAQDELDEAIYQIIGLSSQQIAQARDSVRYMIKRGNEDEIVSDEIIQGYCKRVCSQINGILKSAKLHLKAVIYEIEDPKSPQACKFEILQQGNTEPEIDRETFANIEELKQSLPPEYAEIAISRWQQGEQTIVYDHMTIWIIKDKLAKAWCQVAALQDADKIVQDHMEQNQQKQNH